MRMCSECCVCCPAVGQRTKRQAWFSFCLRYGQAEAGNPLHCLPRAVDTRYGQVKCQVWMQTMRLKKRRGTAVFPAQRDGGDAHEKQSKQYFFCGNEA
ncbi:hypothetical protein T08_3310 [Trichinella sp. T8]|nr:hypothetical protein T08_3310 [Trichinella sp. T8]